MKFTIGTLSTMDDFSKDIDLIKSCLLYADEIELIGMVEYAVFKYLPDLINSNKNLTQILSSVESFLKAVQVPNSEETIGNLEYALNLLRFSSPLHNKKKYRTPDEIKAQIKANAIQKELITKFEKEVMEPLANRPYSAQITDLIQKGLVSVFDYEMTAFDEESLAGGYVGCLLNIFQGCSFPLFDEQSNKVIKDSGVSKLIDVCQLNGEYLRHAGIATSILMTLPTLQSASFDELIDFKKQNLEHLMGFRTAIYEYSENISSLPWDNDFQFECAKLYDTKVAPQIRELNELFTETSVLKNFGKKVLADEEARKKAAFMVGGLAVVITSGNALMGIVRALISIAAKTFMTTNGANAFLKAFNHGVEAKTEADEKRKTGRKNVMYYYYLAQKQFG